MNKKTLSALSVAVAAFIVAMLCFVFITPPSSEQKQADISGKWQIISEITGPESFERVENTYVSFENGEFKQFVSSELKAQSGYTYKNNIISLVDLGKEYTVLEVSPEFLKLCPDSSNLNYCISLIAYNGDDFKADKQSYIKGSWKLVCKAGAAVQGEVISFDGESLHNFKNGESTPSASAEYYFDKNGILCCEKMNQRVEVIAVSDTLMFFLELESGYIWQLERM